jgi:hypothetical protein
MTITFGNDNDVIVYAFEKIISYARNTQQVFVAQCVWWLVSALGLEVGLISYIDNFHTRVEITVSQAKSPGQTDKENKDLGEDPQDNVLRESNQFLLESWRLRDVATHKKTGQTKTVWINPSAVLKQSLRVSKNKRTDYPLT